MIMKFSGLFVFFMAMMLAFAGVAFAQDDDTADDDADDDTADDDTADDDADDDAADDDFGGGEFVASLEFNNPAALEAETAYDFEFTVTNNTLAGADVHNWINEVDLWMPSTEYVISTIADPDPVNPQGGEWTSENLIDADQNPVGIKWLYSLGSTSESHGDIAEGEALEFAFTARTDAAATDGFDYKIVADSLAEMTGTAYIVEPIGDDDTDDDTEGDDDEADDDDEDDDASGCCG
jgi:hypothetical protein